MIQIHKFTYLFGAAFKYDILLTLVQPPLPHCPEVKDSVLSLEQLIQDIYGKHAVSYRCVQQPDG